MKTYYAQVAISVSDDTDPKDVFDYVENAVRSWGELRLIDDVPGDSQDVQFGQHCASEYLHLVSRR